MGMGREIGSDGSSPCPSSCPVPRLSSVPGSRSSSRCSSSSSDPGDPPRLWYDPRRPTDDSRKAMPRGEPWVPLLMSGLFWDAPRPASAPGREEVRFRGEKGEPDRPCGVLGAFLLAGGDGTWLSRGTEAAGGEGDLSLVLGWLVAVGAWVSGVWGGPAVSGSGPSPPPPMLVGKTNWALTPEAKSGVVGVEEEALPLLVASALYNEAKLSAIGMRGVPAFTSSPSSSSQAR